MRQRALARLCGRGLSTPSLPPTRQARLKQRQLGYMKAREAQEKNQASRPVPETDDPETGGGQRAQESQQSHNNQSGSHNGGSRGRVLTLLFGGSCIASNLVDPPKELEDSPLVLASLLPRLYFESSCHHLATDPGFARAVDTAVQRVVLAWANHDTSTDTFAGDVLWTQLEFALRKYPAFAGELLSQGAFAWLPDGMARWASKLEIAEEVFEEELEMLRLTVSNWVNLAARDPELRSRLPVPSIVTFLNLGAELDMPALMLQSIRALEIIVHDPTSLVGIVSSGVIDTLLMVHQAEGSSDIGMAAARVLLGLREKQHSGLMEEAIQQLPSLEDELRAFEDATQMAYYSQSNPMPTSFRHIPFTPIEVSVLREWAGAFLVGSIYGSARTARALRCGLRGAVSGGVRTGLGSGMLVLLFDTGYHILHDWAQEPNKLITYSNDIPRWHTMLTDAAVIAAFGILVSTYQYAFGGFLLASVLTVDDHEAPFRITPVVHKPGTGPTAAQ